jgi:hypothetical protein
MPYGLIQHLFNELIPRLFLSLMYYILNLNLIIMNEIMNMISDGCKTFFIFFKKVQITL